jgi:AraC-like DNA-binding protein
MSKISDYLAQLRRMDDERRTSKTVAEFADDLHRPVDTLLSQFRAAGVSLAGEDSLVSEEQMEALLDHLRSIHNPDKGSRKRIRFKTRAELSYEAVAGSANGAEWDVLCEFASEVLWEQPIDPLLQQLVNVIVAKAVLVGSLPPARRGRPVAEGAQEFGLNLAEDFWAMRDSGVPYKDAIEELSARHHKDERHLSRIIKEHTSSVGKTRIERDRRRQLWSWIAEEHAKHGPNPHLNRTIEMLATPPLPELSLQDCLDHLRELLARARPTCE